MQLLVPGLITERIRYDMRSYTDFRLDAQARAARAAGLAGAAAQASTRARCSSPRNCAARRSSATAQRDRTTPARRCRARSLSDAATISYTLSAAAARTPLGRRVPVRHPAGLLRALRVGLRLPDARARRAGARRHRLSGRGAESGRWLHDGAPVGRPRLGRSLARSGRGWVRVDPTAVVAPLRIERGAAETRAPGERRAAGRSEQRCDVAAHAALQLGGGPEQLEPVGARRIRRNGSAHWSSVSASRRAWRTSRWCWRS